MGTERTGRLLRCAGPAAWNMALDEVLLNGAPTASRIILRLYGWNRPAVTLGRFQNTAQSVDMEFCRLNGVEVVRRPTGGRAVYHATDLTYSLLFPEAAAGGRSIRESYRLIAHALSQAFNRAGLNIQPGELEKASNPSRADCFAHLSIADLAIAGRKLIGSAQMRRGGWVLQQGSIRAWPMETPNGIFHSVITKESVRPASSELNRHLVEKAIAEELAVLFHCIWQEASLDKLEEEETLRLVAQKYGAKEWTLNGETVSEAGCRCGWQDAGKLPLELEGAI